MQHPVKKTKIVATVGPSSNTAPIIRALLLAGVNVFRLNFSHGTHQNHLEAIRAIREQSVKLGIFPAILGDLQGPKIRTGKTPGDAKLQLKTGSIVVLTANSETCTESRISIDYPHLVEEIEVGQKIMINDGAVQLRATRVDKTKQQIHCTVESGGTFSSHKGVNLPNVTLSIPSLTRKDRRDLDFILANNLHYVALSFVRSAKDLAVLQRILKKTRSPIKVIAKIEKPEAAQNINEILSACDGIMVARGDLGVETSLADVPILQKTLIVQANQNGKLVIVATQMLESMIEKPVPTRAESTDVANAILDGTDATMLSGETAIGSYPVAAVEFMARIAQRTESSNYYPKGTLDLRTTDHYPPHAVAEAAAWASRDLGGVPVMVFTLSGDTALYLSKVRNESAIFAFTPSELVAGVLSLAWNTRSYVIDHHRDIIAMQKAAEAIMLKTKSAAPGDLVVVVCGTSLVRGATSTLRIKRIGEV